MAVSTQTMRVAFLVDGFNLYHSLCSAGQRQGIGNCKWLDLQAVSRALLPSIDAKACLSSIDYFTALPTHLSNSDPSRLERHRVYLRALATLRNPGVKAHIGRIRRQNINLRIGGVATDAVVWREKGTDVALAATLMSLGHRDACDLAVILSGDTDYATLPGIFRETYGKELIFALPYGRAPSELAQTAPRSLIMSPELYQSCQLSPQMRLPSGKALYRPAAWSDETSA